MTKYSLALLGFLISAILGIAQDISGNWQGFIPVGEKNVRLIFHITKSAEGLNANFDSPDQNAYRLSCNSIHLLKDSLLIQIDLIKGGYKGKWDGNDEIKGIFSQGQSSMVVNLKRLQDSDLPKDPASKIKPQTPKPPFNYSIEEVGYENILENVHLGGTLTKPNSGTKFPVVILITGSGPQDRDETIGMHKSFWVIADYLTKQGIAVLRFDDRGVGKSSGDFSKATSADFASDVEAGIEYLKTRTDIDPTKIGLIGHSEGGFIAPFVAARSKDVAFIVMLSGPAIGGKQTMYYQAVEKPMASSSSLDRMAYGNFYNQMLHVAFDEEAKKDIVNYTRNVYVNWKKQQSDSTLQHILKGPDEEVIKTMAAGFKVLLSPWWPFFLSYDIETDLRKLKIPVFALNGEKDEQVDPKANLALLNKIFFQNKNPKSKVYEVPGVNHLFQHCKACGSVKEYLELEETFDTTTLQMIGDWIKEQIK